MEESGFSCRVLKDSDKGVLEISDITEKKLGPIVIGYGLIDRLLYECLSVKTFVDYTGEVAEKLINGEILE